MYTDDTGQSSPDAGLPLISIGVPVYNGADHLVEALESALGQDYANLELIVCDNASEDDTEAICRRFAEADPRVRYLRNPTNIGFLPNFRRVLDEARGTYFSWLADDDVLSDMAYIKTVVTYLEDHRDVVTCTTAFRLIDSEFGFAGRVKELPELDPGRWPKSRREFFRWPYDWVEGLTIYGIHRRKLLEKITIPERTYKGRPHLFWWEADVLTALCALGRIVALPQCLRSYRLAVATVGTGMSQSVSTFDLCLIGLKMKLILIGRACRMPGPWDERLRLVGTAVANLFRSNLGQPYNHEYVRHWREVGLANLLKIAGERSQLIDSIHSEIDKRREIAVALGLDPGSPPEVDEQADTSSAHKNSSELTPQTTRGKGTRVLLRNFFRPPADWQIRRGQEVHEYIGRLNISCENQLREIERLHAEAESLQQIIDSAPDR